MKQIPILEQKPTVLAMGIVTLERLDRHAEAEPLRQVLDALVGNEMQAELDEARKIFSLASADYLPMMAAALRINGLSDDSVDRAIHLNFEDERILPAVCEAYNRIIKS